jgi:hypothetical protein
MIPCPRCQQAELAPRPIGFTWWGGVVGAKLLHHVECVRCATRYNGRSGRSNDGAIAIYMVVAGVLALLLGYAVIRGSH